MLFHMHNILGSWYTGFFLAVLIQIQNIQLLLDVPQNRCKKTPVMQIQGILEGVLGNTGFVTH